MLPYALAYDFWRGVMAAPAPDEHSGAEEGGNVVTLWDEREARR